MYLHVSTQCFFNETKLEFKIFSNIYLQSYTGNYLFVARRPISKNKNNEYYMRSNIYNIISHDSRNSRNSQCSKWLRERFKDKENSPAINYTATHVELAL